VAELLGAAYFARGERGATVYARGSAPGRSDFLPGLADVDLVVVLDQDPSRPGAAEERGRRRWLRLFSRLPAIAVALDHPRIHEEQELHALQGASTLTYGLDADRPPDNAYLGRRATRDVQRALARPGLYGDHDGWRRIRGPDRRLGSPERDAAARKAAGWFELVWFSRMAVGSCLDGRPPRSTDVCVKSVAEAARVWLWLAHGERAGDRREVFERALRLMPEEERGLRRALDLRRDLPTSPEAPWDELLPVALRITARVARLLEADDPGGRSVRLAGRNDDPSLLPFVDWRVLSDPMAAEERFFVAEGSPGDPAALRALASAHPGSPFPALFEDGLMVLPSPFLVEVWRSTVQCRVTDPVSFALAGGSIEAEFSGLHGWRAEDTAQRAVIEHRAWLEAPAGSWRGSLADGGGRALEVLLTAARASLFRSSLESGEPELCLTVEEVTRRLSAPVAEDALAAYRELVSTGAGPTDSLLAALQEAVQALPDYASASIRSTTAGRSAIT
jgi:hypothetical protein